MTFDPTKLTDNPLALHPELAELQAHAMAQAAAKAALAEPKPEGEAAGAATDATPKGPTPSGKRPSEKYQNDPQKLAEGYDHQFAETQRIIQERNEAQARAQALDSLLKAQMANQPKPEPVAPRPTAKPLDLNALVEAGIPVDQLTEFVRQAVGEVMAPFTEGIAARAQLAKEYPNLDQFDKEMDSFLAANPNIQAKYNDKMAKYGVGEAFEYAIQAYQIAHPPTAAPDPEPGKGGSMSGAAEAQAAARRDAENLASGGGRPMTDEAAAKGQALQAAYQAAAGVGFAHGSPEMTQYLRLRFEGTSVAQKATQ